jgi:hypothetical protein
LLRTGIEDVTREILRDDDASLGLDLLDRLVTASGGSGSGPASCPDSDTG